MLLVIFACLVAAMTQHALSRGGGSAAEGGDGGVSQREVDAANGQSDGGLLSFRFPEPQGSGATGRDVRTSSLSGFLDDLEALQVGKGVCASIVFQENRDLPSLAGDVLEAYAGKSSVDLVTSGYLDLKGNVWGAVLRGGASWCDVLLVSTQDDAVSCVRVTRVFSEEGGS